MHLALLANPSSGSADPSGIAALLESHGAVVDVFETGDEDAAAACGCDRLVVAGGDGSVARAAAAAAACETPLAVVPAGTANDFARAMDVPDDRAAACELAATGARTRAVDLAWCDETPFVNVASMGLSVLAASHAETMKAGVGALGYPLAALRVACTAEAIPCSVSVDGERLHDGPAWQVLVANTGAFGGVASIEAEVDDAKLRVLVLERGPRRRLARHAWGLGGGDLAGQPGVVEGTGRCVVVRLTDSDQREVNCDGDLVHVGRLARLRIDGRAFRLVVPDRSA